ncbi:MAG: hypothetical protein ACXWXZ_19855, partial [Candidatus Binatia bacterium]
ITGRLPMPSGMPRWASMRLSIFIAVSMVVSFAVLLENLIVLTLAARIIYSLFANIAPRSVS